MMCLPRVFRASAACLKCSGCVFAAHLLRARYAFTAKWLRLLHSAAFLQCVARVLNVRLLYFHYALTARPACLLRIYYVFTASLLCTHS